MPTAAYPKWMALTMTFAGVYNLVWGAWVVFWPTLSFEYSGLEKPGRKLDYPELWQCIGMIVGVYGVGYLASARNPLRHWPVILVGFLGKCFGPMGYVYGVLRGETAPATIITNIFNDLIWLPAFALILLRAYRQRHSPE